MITALLDGNVYNKLRDDPDARAWAAECVSRGVLQVVATPVVLDELRASPFAGLPDFFPVAKEPEAVFVLGMARLGMARLGTGEVFTAHRGESAKTKDAIIAESADSLAEIFVSEDRRCRTRLARISSRCRALTYSEFREWLLNQNL